MTDREKAIVKRLAPGRPASELPVLALRDGVLLPDELTQLAVERPSSISALRAAEKAGGHVVAVAQLSADVDEPQLDHLYEIGCAARILEIVEAKVGVTVRLNGLLRVRIESIAGNDPMVARTSLLSEPIDTSPPLDAFLVDWLRNIAIEALARKGVARKDAASYVAAAAGPGRVADIVIGALAIPMPMKQKFLEEPNIGERVAILTDLERFELGPGTLSAGWLSRLLTR